VQKKTAVMLFCYYEFTVPEVCQKETEDSSLLTYLEL